MRQVRGDHDATVVKTLVQLQPVTGTIFIHKWFEEFKRLVSAEKYLNLRDHLFWYIGGKR